MSEYTYNKTNEEWAELVVAYQKTESADDFYNVYTELLPVARTIGGKLYFENKGYGITREEFVNEAEFSIWRTVQAYDAEKGGSVVSMLKVNAEWAVSDNLLRPLLRKQGEFDRSAESFITQDQEDLTEYIGEECKEIEELFEHENERTFFTILDELLRDFYEECSTEDRNVLSALIKIYIEHPEYGDKHVNKALNGFYPGVKPATLRKQKQRALGRFTAFAKEKGYSDLLRSQF